MCTLINSKVNNRNSKYLCSVKNMGLYIILLHLFLKADSLSTELNHRI